MNRFTREVKELSIPELENKLETLKKDLYEFRYKAQLGTLDKVSSIHNTKKNIARIMTIIGEKHKASQVQS